MQFNAPMNWEYLFLVHFEMTPEYPKSVSAASFPLMYAEWAHEAPHENSKTLYIHQSFVH